MAEQTGQEKTEQATPKRRDDARKKGQVPRSRELNTTFMLVGAALVMLFFGGQLFSVIAEMLRESFTIERAQLNDPKQMVSALREALQAGLLAIVPFLAVMVLLALAAPLLISGWVVSTDQMSVKFSRMDPIKGLGRMFAWRGLLELIKALLKFALILAVAISLLWSDIGELLMLGQEPLQHATQHAGHLITVTFVILSCTLILLPLIDVPFQLWDHSRQIRMSFQEIKEEFKQSDGSPELRARIRQAQREAARGRMMQAIPQADVIVTNPTHYAVALRYDQGKMRAPVVVAKGMDLIAAQIRTLGTEHHIPIVSAPPLARALYYSTKLDKEIPMGLYLAVAKLLAYVYQLKHWTPQPDRKTVEMPEFQIPEEFVKEGVEPDLE